MSNSRPKATLEIDLADLPMLAHGLLIMRATAMPGMCGSKRHYARADAYYQKLLAQMPPVATKFDEYKFCDMILRIDRGELCTIEVVKQYSDKYEVHVKFHKDVVYKNKDFWVTKEEADQIAKDMSDLIEQIQPL